MDTDGHRSEETKRAKGNWRVEIFYELRITIYESKHALSAAWFLGGFALVFNTNPPGWKPRLYVSQGWLTLRGFAQAGRVCHYGVCERGGTWFGGVLWMAAMWEGILWRPGIGDPTMIGWTTTVAYGISAALCFRAWWRGTARKGNRKDGWICGWMDLSANDADGGMRIPARSPESTGESPVLPDELNNGGTKEQRGTEGSANTGLKIPAGSLESTGGSPVLPDGFSRMWLACAVGMVLLGINKQLDLQTLLTEVGRVFVTGEGWYSERRTIQKLFLAILVLLSGSGLILLARKQKRFFIKNPLVLAGIGLLLLYILLRATAIEHVGESSKAALPNTAWWLACIELGGITCVGIAGFKFKKAP